MTNIFQLEVYRADAIFADYLDGAVSRDETKQRLIVAFQLEAPDAETLLRELDNES